MQSERRSKRAVAQVGQVGAQSAYSGFKAVWLFVHSVKLASSTSFHVYVQLQAGGQASSWLKHDAKASRAFEVSSHVGMSWKMLAAESLRFLGTRR